MRIHLTILAAATLSAGLAAQTTYQEWANHSEVTNWTSRASIGSGTGSIFMGVHASTNQGVMDVGGNAVASRFRFIVQDQNCTTRERYDIQYRAGSDAAGPGTAATDLLGGATGLNMPTSTSTGACAWGITTVFTTPVKVPREKHWSFGVGLIDAQPNWTMDGNSIHGASGVGATNSHNAHEGTNREDHCWQIIGTATAATHPSSKRSYRMYTAVADGTVMKLTCGGAPGYGGTFPIASTSTAPQAWGAQLRGGTGASGAASGVSVLLTTGLNAPFGIGANLVGIPAPGALFFGPSASTTGVANVPILPFVPASAAGLGTFHLQGFLGLTAGISLSNSQAVIP